MQTSFTPEQLADPAMAASERILRKCVHCGFCLTSCPTFTLLGDELDSPRGRIYLVKDMLENASTPSAEVVKHIDRCLSCLACASSCPSDVHYGHLIDHARVYVEQRYRRPLPDRVIRWMLAFILPHRRRFRMALRAARLGRPLAGLFARHKALQPLARMLALAPRQLPPAAQLRAPPPPAPGTPSRQVILLQGCAEPVLRPEIQAATSRLLARLGIEVVTVPGEGCCGSLPLHLGREEAALALARRNVDLWDARIAQGGLEAILVTASGCGSTVKDYAHLLRHDLAYAQKAGRVSALAMDINEYLERLGLPEPRSEAAGRVVAWHPPCSLQHGQKIMQAPINLLKAAGFSVRLPAESGLCCGSAGTYNILQGEIAAQLGARKAGALEQLHADVIATANIGCATQITLYAATPVVHLVELLDWATGGPMPAALAGKAT